MSTIQQLALGVTPNSIHIDKGYLLLTGIELKRAVSTEAFTGNNQPSFWNFLVDAGVKTGADYSLDDGAGNVDMITGTRTTRSVTNLYLDFESTATMVALGTAQGAINAFATMVAGAITKYQPNEVIPNPLGLNNPVDYNLEEASDLDFMYNLEGNLSVQPFGQLLHVTKITEVAYSQAA